MRSIAVAVAAAAAAAALVATASPAAAGWRGAEWGMTPQEVADATHVPFASGASRTLVGRVRTGGLDLLVHYDFADAGTLSLVQVDVLSGACGELVRSLRDAGGAPVREVADGADFATAEYRDGAAKNVVQQISAGGACSAYFRPLRTDTF